jgi:hypothetical protein
VINYAWDTPLWRPQSCYSRNASRLREKAVLSILRDKGLVLGSEKALRRIRGKNTRVFIGLRLRDCLKLSMCALLHTSILKSQPLNEKLRFFFTPSQRLSAIREYLPLIHTVTVHAQLPGAHCPVRPYRAATWGVDIPLQLRGGAGTYRYGYGVGRVWGGDIPLRLRGGAGLGGGGAGTYIPPRLRGEGGGGVGTYRYGYGVGRVWGGDNRYGYGVGRVWGGGGAGTYRYGYGVGRVWGGWGRTIVFTLLGATVRPKPRRALAVFPRRRRAGGTPPLHHFGGGVRKRALTGPVLPQEAQQDHIFVDRRGTGYRRAR